MQDICSARQRPFAFLFHYVARRPIAHAVILCAVVAAVACSVSTQYGIKLLVDTLTTHVHSVWAVFAILIALIAADNLCWRLASLVASYTFVQVTGDVRRDLFRHLTLHSPSFFSDRMPAVLTSRITATSNATFTIENMAMWNVLPPCLAAVVAIILLASVSLAMAGVLTVIAIIAVFIL